MPLPLQRLHPPLPLAGVMVGNSLPTKQTNSFYVILKQRHMTPCSRQTQVNREDKGAMNRPGGSFDDVVHSQDHLGGFRGAQQHLTLHLEGLCDAQLCHVTHGAFRHVCRGKKHAHQRDGRRHKAFVWLKEQWRGFKLSLLRSLTQSEGGLVVLVCSSQLSHQVGAVVASVVGDGGRQLEEKTSDQQTS